MMVFGLLFLITCMLVRSQDVTIWQAVIVGLCGFYAALTPIGWAVVAILNQFPFLGTSSGG
jgi:hypothetical protein